MPKPGKSKSKLKSKSKSKPDSFVQEGEEGGDIGVVFGDDFKKGTSNRRSIFDENNVKDAKSTVLGRCIKIFVEAAAHLLGPVCQGGDAIDVATEISKFLVDEAVAAGAKLDKEGSLRNLVPWMLDVVTFDIMVTSSNLSVAFQMMQVGLKLFSEVLHTSKFMNDRLLKIANLALTLLQLCAAVLKEVPVEDVAERLVKLEDASQLATMETLLSLSQEGIMSMVLKFCDKIEPKGTTLKIVRGPTMVAPPFQFGPFASLNRGELLKAGLTIRSLCGGVLVSGLRNAETSKIFGRLLLWSIEVGAGSRTTRISSIVLKDSFLVSCINNMQSMESKGFHTRQWFTPTDIENILTLRLFDVICNADALGPNGLFVEGKTMLRVPSSMTRDIPCMAKKAPNTGTRRSELFFDLKQGFSADENMRSEIVMIVAMVTAHLYRHSERLIDVAARYLSTIASDAAGLWLPFIFQEIGKHIKPFGGVVSVNGWGDVDETLAINVNAFSLAGGMMKYVAGLRIVSNPEAAGTSTPLQCVLHSYKKQVGDPLATFSAALSVPIVVAARHMLPEVRRRVQADMTIGLAIASRHKMFLMLAPQLDNLALMVEGHCPIRVNVLKQVLFALTLGKRVFTEPGVAESAKVCCFIIQRTLDQQRQHKQYVVEMRGSDDPIIAFFAEPADDPATLRFHMTRLKQCCISDTSAMLRARQSVFCMDMSANVDVLEMLIAGCLPRLMRLSCGTMDHALHSSMVEVFCKHGAMIIDLLWRESQDSVRTSKSKLASSGEMLSALCTRPVAFISAVLPFLTTKAVREDFASKVQTMDMLCTYLRLFRFLSNARAKREGRLPRTCGFMEDTPLAFRVAVLDAVTGVLCDVTGPCIGIRQMASWKTPVLEECLIDDMHAAMQRCWYFGLDGNQVGISGEQAELKYWLDEQLNPSMYSTLANADPRDEQTVTAFVAALNEAPVRIPATFVGSRPLISSRFSPPIRAVLHFEIVQATRVIKSVLKLLGEMGRCSMLNYSVVLELKDRIGVGRIPQLLFGPPYVVKDTRIPLEREKRAAFSGIPSETLVLFRKCADKVEALGTNTPSSLGGLK